MWWQLIFDFKTIKELSSTFNENREQYKLLWTLTPQKWYLLTYEMHYYSPVQSCIITLTLVISVLTDPFAASRQYLGETTWGNSHNIVSCRISFSAKHWFSSFITRSLTKHKMLEFTEFTKALPDLM